MDEFKLHYKVLAAWETKKKRIMKVVVREVKIKVRNIDNYLIYQYKTNDLCEESKNSSEMRGGVDVLDKRKIC